eukprot:6199858-Pleurochrysis_carterae.AAC.4
MPGCGPSGTRGERGQSGSYVLPAQSQKPAGRPSRMREAWRAGRVRVCPRLRPVWASSLPVGQAQTRPIARLAPKAHRPLHERCRLSTAKRRNLPTHWRSRDVDTVDARVWRRTVHIQTRVLAVKGGCDEGPSRHRDRVVLSGELLAPGKRRNSHVASYTSLRVFRSLLLGLRVGGDRHWNTSSEGQTGYVCANVSDVSPCLITGREAVLGAESAEKVRSAHPLSELPQERYSWREFVFHALTKTEKPSWPGSAEQPECLFETIVWMERISSPIGSSISIHALIVISLRSKGSLEVCMSTYALPEKSPHVACPPAMWALTSSVQATGDADGTLDIICSPGTWPSAPASTAGPGCADIARWLNQKA